ncbi:DUF4405 domain-containing protein [Candidatus Poribacteria bacterium]|nr:DUF4405 domain-containing protein [Candidatus Poribacteria bacterium]
MQGLNIRRWSTPLIIGAGIFVAITGLFMFFIAENPVKFAHELVGITFSVAIVLHILSNWRPFKRYFSQRGAISIIALAWLVGISLVTTSVLRDNEEPEELIVNHIEQTPIVLLAPVVGMDVSELVDQLSDDGFAVDNPEMSIEQLAHQHNADTDDILLSVFR